MDIYLIFPENVRVDELIRSGTQPKFQSPLSLHDSKLHPGEERHLLRLSHFTSKGMEEKEIPLPEYVQCWVFGERYTQLQSVLIRKILVLDEGGGLKAEFFPPAYRKRLAELLRAGHPTN